MADEKVKIGMAKVIDDKKFMWDGETYDTKEKAKEVMANYEKSKFETRIVEDAGKYLVYTRRVVTEIVLEGEAPI